jgi:hypothetical protein
LRAVAVPAASFSTVKDGMNVAAGIAPVVFIIRKSPGLQTP